MQEVWANIIGWEGHYQVSNFGRVKSLERKVVRVLPYPSILKLPETIKSLTNNGNGYKFVFLKRGGERTKFFVHRLVAQAFIPNAEDKPIVNHKDLNRSNNHITNLEWVTDSENVKHRYRMRAVIEVKEEMAF